MPSRTPPPPGTDPLIGRRLGDRYVLRTLIDRGGFGAVYRAAQIAVDRTVAVKVINADRRADPDIRRRFVREAAAMAAVNHPCVASLYDHGIEPDGLMYLALEYIDGRSLKAALAEAGRIAPARAVHLLRQIVAGVAEAHRFGVVHRDLKPGNIMLTRDALGIERVKVLDFGIARRLDDDCAMTRDGMIIGTPRYAAPEQIRARGVGPWSDQYAIGVVAHCMLAGRPPFDAPAVADLLVAHLRTPAPRLSAPTPTALADIVERCLAKHPTDRFPDLGAVARALDAVETRPRIVLPPTTLIRTGDTTLRDPPADAMAITLDSLAPDYAPKAPPPPTGAVSDIVGAVEARPAAERVRTPGVLLLLALALAGLLMATSGASSGERGAIVAPTRTLSAAQTPDSADAAVGNAPDAMPDAMPDAIPDTMHDTTKPIADGIDGINARRDAPVVDVVVREPARARRAAREPPARSPTTGQRGRPTAPLAPSNLRLDWIAAETETP